MPKKALLATLSLILALCTAHPILAVEKKSRVTMWVGWINNPSFYGEFSLEEVEEFRRTHPHIELVTQPGGGGLTLEGMAKLLLAVGGGTGPDLTFNDVSAHLAARGMIEPLDRFIEKDHFDLSQYFPPIIEDMKYEGKIYGLPFSVDVRILYYNRRLFDENGLDADSPPKTWSELEKYSMKLTKRDSSGNYRVIGFLPMLGNDWLWLYGWQNGGEFMSRDGRKCTLNDSRIVSALQWMIRCYDLLGGWQNLQGRYGGDFMKEQVAMQITTDGIGAVNIAQMVPDLDFGVAPAPVPDERYAGKGIFAGQPKFITWSGSFRWVIPKGARNPEGAWEAMKWFSTTPGFMAHAKAGFERARAIAEKEKREFIFIPWMAPNIPAAKAQLDTYAPYLKDRKWKELLKLRLDILPYTKLRPTTPVLSELWREQEEATWDAITYKAPPQAALDRATAVVQRELDKFFAAQK